MQHNEHYEAGNEETAHYHEHDELEPRHDHHARGEADHYHPEYDHHHRHIKT